MTVTPLEMIVAILLLVGTLIRLLASLGLVRFGDVYLRMHASTKAATLGLGFTMAGVALYFGDALITVKLVALGVIYFFTSPTGAQVLARGAHSAQNPMVAETWIDDLKTDELRSEKFDINKDKK